MLPDEPKNSRRSVHIYGLCKTIRCQFDNGAIATTTLFKWAHNCCNVPNLFRNRASLASN